MRFTSLALAFALGALGCDQGSPSPPASSICDPLPSSAYGTAGSYGVGTHDETYVDSSRPTMANGPGYPGDPSGRTLVTTLWYPATSDGPDAPVASGGPFPFLIYSHGFSSGRGEGAYFFPQLASRGYVVLAMDFPLTILAAPGDGPNAADVVNQPGDVSFLLDTQLARNADAADPFYDLVDEARIAAGGLSLGGMTTLLVAFHETLHDPRVAVAMAIAPASLLFDADFYGFVSMPLLLMAGDIDAILEYSQNARAAFDNANSPATLVTMANATHTGFASYATIFDDVPNADAAGCQVVLGSGTADQTSTWSQLVDALGGAAAGVVAPASVSVCATDPLPVALCPTRQQALAKEVIQAYLDSQLAVAPADRAAAASFIADLPSLRDEDRVLSK